MSEKTSLDAIVEKEILNVPFQEINTYIPCYNPIKANFWHPNRISAAGGAFSISALAALHFETAQYVAPALASIGCLLDFADGYVAKKRGLMTAEGAMLDPLMDKLKMYSTGIHMAVMAGMTYATSNNITYTAIATLGTGIILNFSVDGISQKLRGDIIPQIKTAYKAIVHPQKCIPTNIVKSGKEAVNPGKYKTAIQNVIQVGYVTGYAYYEGIHEKITEFFGKVPTEDIINSASYGSGGALIVAGILGMYGIYLRNKNNFEKAIIDFRKEYF